MMKRHPAGRAEGRTDRRPRGGGSVEPPNSWTQKAASTGLLIAFLTLPLWPLVLTYPYRPATWLGWVLLYLVAVPLLLVLGLFNQMTWHGWGSHEDSGSGRILIRAFPGIALVLYGLGLFSLWRVAGDFLRSHFERW